MTLKQFCKRSINLQSAKQGLFSLIPEAAVHSSFTVNLARFFRTPIRAPCDNRIQIKWSKKSRKIDWKTHLLGSLFDKAAGFRPATLSKSHFSTGVFL